MATVSKNIQAIIEGLGKKHRTIDLVDPIKVYLKGQQELRKLVDEGKIELYEDTDSYWKFRWTDGHVGTDNVDDFIFATKPLKVTNDGYTYIPTRNATKPSTKRHTIIYDMTVPCPLGIGQDNVDMLRKINHIKHKLWKGVLNYARTPKEPITDELGQKLFEQESEWLRTCVSELESDFTFYYGHQFDKRGRIYPRQYPITYQGDEWTKASNLMCLPQIKLTEEGMKALKHDIANHYGLDKESYTAKEAFVDNGVWNRDDADKKILFDRALEYYTEALQTGTTDFSVCIDATASGLQILSILANCGETAQYTNLTDVSQCYDIYARAAQKVIDKTGATNITLKQMRKIVKKPVMTGTYNSEKQSQVAVDTLKREYDISISKEDMLAICESSEAVSKIKAHMKECFRRYGEIDDIKDNTIIRYMMPDGFIVELPIVSPRSVRLTDKALGYSCQMRFEDRRYNFVDGWRSFLPNMIHSVDAYICREMIRRTNYYNKREKKFKSFDIATIHDCFIVHPNYVNIVRRNYLTILKELQDMDIMNYIMNQIHPSFVYDNGYKSGVKNFDITIDENSYALC